MAAIQALQQWCKKQCEGYKDVNITNMTTSFRDGLAFCAILHRHRPDLINFSALRKENVYENNKLAFQVAEDELGIPALLDAEDMVALKVPDRLSILTYVSQYYNYFHGKSPIGGMSGIKRPPSKPNEEPTGKKVVTEPATPSPPKLSPVHVLSEAKINPATRGKENAPVAARRHVLAESTNTLNSNCAACGTHVHLVQRLLVDGKLYHRNCFRCRQCSRTLQSGSYKAGNDPGSLVCSQHEHPAPPQNSLPVCARDTVGENNLTGMTPSSGSYLKGLELKKQAEESIKTIQVPKSSGVVKTPAGDLSDVGTNKAHSVTANLSSWWSDPVRNNSNLQNSLPVTARATAGENNPISTTPSGSYLNIFKKQAEEPIKTIQVPKSSGVVKTLAGDPSDIGANKTHSVTANLRSQWTDPVKNTSNQRESPAASHSSPPSQWTVSSAKTQEARTKFFQSGVGNSGSPVHRTEGVKNQGVPLNSSRVAGESPIPLPRGLGSNSDNNQKDRARNILLHALPGSQPSTNKTGNFSTSSPSSNFKPPPASSALRHFEVKNVSPGEISRPAAVPSAPDKPNRAAVRTPPEVDHFPKDPGHKGNTGTTAQNRFKEHSNQPVNPGSKLDVKTIKAEGPEEKSESPADWRARLKPVPNKPSGQGETRTFGKSADIHKVTINVALNPTQDDKKPASSATALARQTIGTDDPAKSVRTEDGFVLPSSQPQKKKLLVAQLEISGGWEKAKHSWQDSPVSQKSEVPMRIPEKTVASVKPSSPRTVQNPPGSRTRSSPKNHPDYIPEAEIQKEVRQIEKDLDKLELKGVDMEKDLRRCEGDDSEDALMVEWFKLIHEKQLLLRRESELMHKQNQQKLEDKQWGIETELRSLMSKSEFLKTPKERAREDELLKLYVATVDDRNKIIEDLDEDRLREMEEDEMLAAMIQKLDGPRNSLENDKKKTKSPFFRLMRMKN